MPNLHPPHLLDQKPHAQPHPRRPRTPAGLSRGILRALDSPSLAIGCTDDHVHILYTHGKNILIPDLIMHVKRDSSKWLKTQGPKFTQFHWQAGYGAFSVSASRVPAVKRYVIDQPAHHHKSFSFQDEFRRFLKQYRIEYDERYVWD